MPSFFEQVDGIRIHYEKVGSGPQVLLLIPGPIGCTRSDFPDQIDGGLDQDLFTIIAIDLPGYGKSRPPERVYSLESYRNDARKASGLMQKLGHKLYSVLGWSDGAKVGLLLAIENQARVSKLIVWGVVPNFSQYDLDAISNMRDIELMDPIARELYIRAYGRELFEQLWKRHVDFGANASANWDVRKEMRAIKCPTLILHGERDSLIDPKHPVTAEREIADSRLLKFPNGSHNFHQVYIREFNRIVTNFLIE